MPVRFITNNRKEFILFGKVVADTLRDYDPHRQWIISLQGDGNSGKSLLALAADWARNIHLYLKGLKRSDNVHKMAAYHHPDLYPKGFQGKHGMHKAAIPHAPVDDKIYFNDGLGQIDFTKPSAAQEWQEMLEKLKGTKLIYLSNVWNWTQLRTRSNTVSAANEILIDMRIIVQVAEEKGFVRLVNYNTGNKELDKRIKAAYDAALSQPSPVMPKRRRKPRAPGPGVTK